MTTEQNERLSREFWAQARVSASPEALEQRRMDNEADEQARRLVEHVHELGASVEDDTYIHSFIRCQACVERGQTERLEAGITRTGITVQCKKHGVVVHYTAESLRRQVTRGPQCDCCPGGRHRS